MGRGGTYQIWSPGDTLLGVALPGPGSPVSQVPLQRSLQSPPVTATGTFLFIIDDRTVPFQVPVQELLLVHRQVKKLKPDYKSTHCLLRSPSLAMEKVSAELNRVVNGFTFRPGLLAMDRSWVAMWEEHPY